MKFSKLSQLALASAIGLIVATFLTACQLVTIDFVYVAASAGTSAGSAGQIYGYAVDASSGAVRSAITPVASGGTSPVAMASTTDYLNLYVANQGNNTVAHFAIADNGTLTMKDSVTLPTTPVYLAVNQTNTYLYVISGTNSGTLTEYALSSGTIGSATSTQTLAVPGYSSDTIIPTGVTVLFNNGAVYVSAYDKSAYNPGGSTTSNANPGWLFGYAVGTGGTLTAVSGSPYQAGVKPSAVTTEPTNRFLYVTDYASNELIGYEVLSTNVLTFLINGPFKTGNEPNAITIDPRGIYMYITNSLDNTLSSFAISLPTGSPSAIVGSGSSSGNTTDTDPVSVTVEPSLGRYVYTANRLGNSISGFKLNPETGALSANQATPYPTGAYPMAVIAVPHGNHATQSITP
jgi:6-phosphogluconolactonase (cycloisomerase 2 family)